jgi:hypothetical protein
MGDGMDRRAFLISAMALSGCAAPVKFDTASGRPERLFNAPPETVRAALVSELVNRQYTITQESQSLVVGEKLSDNVAANLLMGTGARPQVSVRASFTMINTGSGTRVVGDLGVVQNKGTPFENVIPMSNSQSATEMQSALDAISV